MKHLFLIILVTFSTEIYARDNLLLQCLAKEESRLHKDKIVDSLYRLNQNFLNELSTNNDISIKKNFVDDICHSATLSPSIGFLRLLLIKEADIYDLSLSEVDPAMRPFKMGYINEFQKQVPHLFISYISGIQSEMADSKCIEKAIPEISYFIDRIKYLEDEISIHQVMSDKKKIETIFKKLLDLNRIKRECNQNKKNELQMIMEKNKKARS
jgi:hypothetical protein